MGLDPIQVLQAARHGAASTRRQSGAETLIVAGATGSLGSAVVWRLVGSQRFGAATVLAREAIRTGMQGVSACVVPTPAPALSPSPRAEAGCCTDWPLLMAETAVVLFDPPRLYYQRERALWTPTPAQLPALAQWLHRCGVRSLAVVMPHQQGRLPDALKRGLASLDEHAVAAVGFERLLIVRSAEKPLPARGGAASWGSRIARAVLSAMQYMVPSSEQPVRASRIAELVDLALQHMPAGTHVVAPELVWRAAQGDLRQVLLAWLRPDRL